MYKRVIFVGLLMLPGAFFVLGAACIHPRLRRGAMELSGFARPAAMIAHVCAGVRRRLL